MSLSGLSVQDALDTSIAYMQDRVSGWGGAIALSIAGQVGVSYTTKSMPWCSIAGGRLRHAIYKDETVEEELS